MEFYYGQVASVANNEVYIITAEKYRDDVEYIRQQENKVVGHVTVVDRYDTGNFQLGTLLEILPFCSHSARHKLKTYLPG